MQNTEQVEDGGRWTWRGKEYLVKGDVEDVEEGKVNVAESD